MNILFCGSCLPRIFETKIQDLSVAGNQYQNNLIKNLKNKGNVHILSYVGISMDISEVEIQKVCYEEGYKPIIATNKIKAFLEYRKQLKKEVKWADIVITYNNMYPWIYVGKMARKRGGRSVLVLADYTPPLEEKNILKKIYSYIMGNDFQHYTKVVLLSPGSKQYISKNQENIVINGCLDLNKFKDIKPPKKKDYTVIVYSGVLSKITGVDLLLKAIELVEKKEFKFIICGQGMELEETIKNAVEKDSRIEYRGFLSTEDYKKTIEEADILMNPRNMNFMQNKNNFPSKILEYLAAGRQVISTKFMGWEEYRDYIEFVESTPEDLAIAIQESARETQEKIYERNRKFVKKFAWEYEIDKFL